jgi:hypothetical protein
MGMLNELQLAMLRDRGETAFDTTVTRTRFGTPTRTDIGGYIDGLSTSPTTFDAKILKRDRSPVEVITGTEVTQSSNEYEILLPAGSDVLVDEILVHSSGSFHVRGTDEGKSDEIYRVVIATKEE